MRGRERRVWLHRTGFTLQVDRNVKVTTAGQQTSANSAATAWEFLMIMGVVASPRLSSTLASSSIGHRTNSPHRSSRIAFRTSSGDPPGIVQQSLATTAVITCGCPSRPNVAVRGLYGLYCFCSCHLAVVGNHTGGRDSWERVADIALTGSTHWLLHCPLSGTRFATKGATTPPGRRHIPVGMIYQRRRGV